jgi:hypothetical protein
VERGHAVAVDLAQHLLRLVVVGQRDDGVRVGVDHRLRGQEAVQQRLDGRPRATGLLEGEAQVVDHLLVAHVVALEQGEHVVHAHAGEVLAPDRLEVGARALDPQHALLAPAVVALHRLDRGVAPPQTTSEVSAPTRREA